MRVVGTDDVTIHALDEPSARAAGQLCAATQSSDVVDASIAILARRLGAMTVTSDPDDLRLLDPGIDLVSC